MPSLWVWSLASWMTGVGLIWFLAYRMEMASPYTTDIPVYQPVKILSRDKTAAERERLRTMVIAAAAVFFVVTVIAFSFGG